MTESSGVKKFLLAVAGLLLGLLLYTFYILGGIMTFAGLLVERATVPVPQASLQQPASDLRTELLAFLGQIELGGMAQIDEESVNRLAARAILELPADQPIRVHRARLDLESAELDAELLVGITAPPTSQAGPFRLRPLAANIALNLHAVPGEQGLLLSLEELRLGRLRLPLERIEEYLTATDLSEWGLPLVKQSSLAYSLPYELLGGPLPAALNLEGLEIRTDALAVRLRVDRALQRELLDETVPLLREQGAALVAAVAAAFPDGEEGLLEEVQALAALAEERSLIPESASALVSYVENQVWAEPPKGERFIPGPGTDLFAGTLLETGEASYIEMILRDKSVLKIGENTRFSLDELPAEDTPKARFSLLSGAVRARVAKALQPDYAFQTPSAVCGVRGTDLSIELADGRSLALSVLEGSVALIPESGGETRVEAGRQISADRKALQRGTHLSSRAIDANEQRRLEEKLSVVSHPEDAAAVREERRFWLTMDGLKGLVTRIAMMEDEKRERLGTELEERLDADAIDRSFERLMGNPEFAAMIESFGIEGIPYP